jgi:hypothetical protein
LPQSVSSAKAGSAMSLARRIDSLSPKLNNQENSQTDKPYHARNMSWLAGTAQRLKRVLNIDITEYEKCQKKCDDNLFIGKIKRHFS